MGRMDAEKFAEAFEKFLECRRLLVEMQKVLRCGTVDDVLFFEKDNILHFAKHNGLVPAIEGDDGADECCHWRIVFEYKGAELVVYLSQKEYLFYQAEGLLP